MTVANWAIKQVTPNSEEKIMQFSFTAGSTDTVMISGLSIIKGGTANLWTGLQSSGGMIVESLIFSGAAITVCTTGSYNGICWGTA